MPGPNAPAAPPRGVRRLDPALVVMLGGVCAALHVGKLPPALHTLQQAFGLTLVQAGFLLSLVQLAGMTAGVAFGALADGIGLRRSMLAGLVLLALASAAGGGADGVPMLMLLRACEGCGFLLAVLPAPALLRRLVPVERVSLMFGLWGAYMPLATALVLLLGPLAIAAFGWRAWWFGLGALTAAMALWLARAVPAEPPPQAAAAGAAARGAAAAWTSRLACTLAAPGPWLVAATFAAYSAQWLAIVGFLPVIYTEAGFGAATTGALTAAVAAVNMIGNVGAGQLLHRGWPAPRLLVIGFVTMALAGAATFAATASGPLLPHPARYAAVLLLSAVGGLIPATLFALAVRLAPGEAMISSTVGWMQQWSSLGQFVGPPLVAAVTSAAGGWQRTWLVTGACCLGGLALSARLAVRLRQPARAACGHG